MNVCPIDPKDAAALLKVLRSTLDEAAFNQRLARAVTAGYQTLGAFDDDGSLV